MSAFGMYRTIWVSWTNPANLDLASMEVWVSATNDRSAATHAITVPTTAPGAVQRWPHANLAPGTVRYYWVRPTNRTGKLGSFTPASPTAGWTATATAVTASDLPVAKADSSTKGIATFAAGDFNDDGSGLLSIDYANAQKATSSQPGLLTAADWTAFDAKPTVSNGSFTITTTGHTTAQTGTAYWEKHGHLVLLWIPTLDGTSNATTFTLTGLPSAIQPIRTLHLQADGTDNGVNVRVPVLGLNASDTLTLYNGVVDGAWTNSGQKRLLSVMLVYALI